MRRRIVKLLLAVTMALGASSVVNGDARSEAQQAQRRLEEAECRVRDLAGAIDNARLSVAAAVARRNDAVVCLETAKARVATSSAAINDAHGRMTAVAEAARAAAATAEQRR